MRRLIFWSSYRIPECIDSAFRKDESTCVRRLNDTCDSTSSAAALCLVVADVLSDVLAQEAALPDKIGAPHSPALDVLLVITCANPRGSHKH